MSVVLNIKDENTNVIDALSAGSMAGMHSAIIVFHT